MRIYEPLKMLDKNGVMTEKWKMCVRSDEEKWAPHAVGHCNACSGHDTPEEAREHFREWELDLADYGGVDEKQSKCLECNEWTQRYTIIRPSYKPFSLCRAHCSREFLEKHHKV